MILTLRNLNKDTTYSYKILLMRYFYMSILALGFIVNYSNFLYASNETLLLQAPEKTLTLVKSTPNNVSLFSDKVRSLSLKLQRGYTISGVVLGEKNIDNTSNRNNPLLQFGPIFCETSSSCLFSTMNKISGSPLFSYENYPKIGDYNYSNGSNELLNKSNEIVFNMISAPFIHTFFYKFNKNLGSINIRSISIDLLNFPTSEIIFPFKNNEDIVAQSIHEIFLEATRNEDSFNPNQKQPYNLILTQFSEKNKDLTLQELLEFDLLTLMSKYIKENNINIFDESNRKNKLAYHSVKIPNTSLNLYFKFYFTEEEEKNPTIQTQYTNTDFFNSFSTSPSQDNQGSGDGITDKIRNPIQLKFQAYVSKNHNPNDYYKESLDKSTRYYHEHENYKSYFAKIKIKNQEPENIFFSFCRSFFYGIFARLDLKMDGESSYYKFIHNHRSINTDFSNDSSDTIIKNIFSNILSNQDDIYKKVLIIVKDFIENGIKASSHKLGYYRNSGHTETNNSSFYYSDEYTINNFKNDILNNPGDFIRINNTLKLKQAMSNFQQTPADAYIDIIHEKTILWNFFTNKKNNTFLEYLFKSLLDIKNISDERSIITYNEINFNNFKKSIYHVLYLRFFSFIYTPEGKNFLRTFSNNIKNINNQDSLTTREKQNILNLIKFVFIGSDASSYTENFNSDDYKSRVTNITNDITQAFTLNTGNIALKNSQYSDIEVLRIDFLNHLYYFFNKNYIKNN